MSVMDTIRKRRSIRKYAPQEVPPEAILELLEAAGWAPSAHNAQPWRFIVLTTALKKRELAEAMGNAWRADLKKAGTYSQTLELSVKSSEKRFTEAPALIVACLTMQDMIVQPDQASQKSEHDLAVQSLGAAIQNLILAAATKKLGACWSCAPIFCQNAVRGVLNIPPEVEPQALITIGLPAESPIAPARKPVKEYSHSECWG